MLKEKNSFVRYLLASCNILTIVFHLVWEFKLMSPFHIFVLHCRDPNNQRQLDSVPKQKRTVNRKVGWIDHLDSWFFCRYASIRSLLYFNVISLLAVAIAMKSLENTELLTPHGVKGSSRSSSPPATRHFPASVLRGRQSMRKCLPLQVQRLFCLECRTYFLLAFLSQALFQNHPS